MNRPIMLFSLLLAGITTGLIYSYNHSPLTHNKSGHDNVELSEPLPDCTKHSKRTSGVSDSIMIGEGAGLYETTSQNTLALGKNGILTLCEDGTLFIRGMVVLTDPELHREVIFAVRQLISYSQTHKSEFEPRTYKK